MFPCKKTILHNLVFFLVFAVFFVLPGNIFATPFFEGGAITSNNFLPISGTSIINSVSYSASSIPAGTSLKIQFSYDGNSWYNSSGVKDSWSTLSLGTNTIDLSGLGWKKAYFFYKVWFVSDGSATPVLDSVSVAFTSFEGTYYTYSSDGTLVSNDLLTVDGVSSINSFNYVVSSIPPNTGIQIQFSHDGNSWYSSAGVSNAYDTLSAGTNSIDLTALGWAGSHFFYRAVFTSDGNSTPVLDSVSLNYTSNNYYWVGPAGGNWNNGAHWSAVSGGAGGIGVPSSADTAIFDAGDTDSVTVDTNISVGNIKINSGYAGIITQTASSTIMTAGVLSQNAGTLILVSSNTITGGVTLNAGTLRINSAGAIGTSTLTIGGGTIDNTSGSPITLSNNNAQSWNGDFTFAGTNDLNLGTGTTTLTANRIVTVNGASSTLTVGGVITGAYSLTKTGAGGLVLDGVNTYLGGTTLASGTLTTHNSSSLGTGAYSQTGGALKVSLTGILNGDFVVSGGTVDFLGESIFGGLMTLSPGVTAVFNDTSYNRGTINGNVKFPFILNGTATLSGSMVWGTTTGSVKGTVDDILASHWIFRDTSFNTGIINVASSSTVKFYNNSYNSGSLTVASGGVVDFYNSSSNDNGTISVALGGMVNFHDSSVSENSTLSIASGGEVNFYDSSANNDGVATVFSGGTIGFHNYSYNNGTVNGNAVFHDDVSQNIGTVTGSTTRQYNINASTTRNFTTEGGHNDWIIIAKGVVVDISNAIYNVATNIFKALSDGFFFFGQNSSGGPVVPQVSVTSPVSGVSTIKWTPSISWDDSVVCEYKIDNDTSYHSLACSNNGSDIPRPTATAHTLFLRGTDARGNVSEKSLSFTYDNRVPIYTMCGADLLDESTRPFYYLQGNVDGNCVVTANNIELRGAETTSSTGFSVAGDVIANGLNINLKNIIVLGTVSTNATTTGGYAGNIIIENSTVATTTANGAEGGANIDGGDGGDITIATSTTGVIMANGGDPIHNGGDAGLITITYSIASASGTPIYANGGDSVGCGDGGSGGDVNLTNTSGYVVTNIKGADAIPPENCTPSGKSQGSGGSVQTVGVYHPPGWTAPAPVATPATRSGTTLASIVKNLMDRYSFGDTKTPLVIPVASVKPVTFKPLPTFGGTGIHSFSFESIIGKFLFAPLSFAGYPQLTSYLAAQGLKTQQDLFLKKDKTTALPLPKLNKDIPDGLLMVSANNTPVPLTARYSTQYTLVEAATVQAGAPLTISLYPTTKGIVTATFNNTTYTFKKLGTTSLLSITLTAPTTTGTYILKATGAPLPLSLTVVKATQTTKAPSTPTLLEKVKKQSVWGVLKFWK
ncbi:MAG: autotransporter-associated beta strand repeat-containing protein [Candidatus Paceibacterota bacterium]|jgi:autotransporter-associated beta strand protein